MRNVHAKNEQGVCLLTHFITPFSSAAPTTLECHSGEKNRLPPSSPCGKGAFTGREGLWWLFPHKHLDGLHIDDIAEPCLFRDRLHLKILRLRFSEHDVLCGGVHGKGNPVSLDGKKWVLGARAGGRTFFSGEKSGVVMFQ